MFALPAVSASRTARSAPHLWLGEVVATAGLVLVLAFYPARYPARPAACVEPAADLREMAAGTVPPAGN